MATGHNVSSTATLVRLANGKLQSTSEDPYRKTANVLINFHWATVCGLHLISVHGQVLSSLHMRFEMHSNLLFVFTEFTDLGIFEKVLNCIGASFGSWKVLWTERFFIENQQWNLKCKRNVRNSLWTFSRFIERVRKVHTHQERFSQQCCHLKMKFLDQQKIVQVAPTKSAPVVELQFNELLKCGQM